MTREPDCAFCDIAAGDESSREVLRTGGVVAFFPLEPATLGHTLVVPIEHVRDIWSIDAPTAVSLASACLRLAHAIRRAMNPEGLNVIQSNGEAATQTVAHLHVHLVPRFVGDAMGRICPPESHYSEPAKDIAWDRIRREATS